MFRALHALNRLKPRKKERTDFLNKHSVTVRSMNDSVLNESSFSCDFFKQNYILSLFEKDGVEFNEALEDYFSDVFSQVEDYDINVLSGSLRELFTNNYQYEVASVANSENIAGLIEKYLDDQSDGLNIKIKQSLVGKATKELKELTYDNTISGIHSAIISKLPKFLKEKKAILSDLSALEKTMAQQAFDERQAYLGSTYLKEKIYEAVRAKKKEISEAQKDKQDVVETFCQQLQKRYTPYEKRVTLINAYLLVSKEFAVPEEHVVGKMANVQMLSSLQKR